MNSVSGDVEHNVVVGSKASDEQSCGASVEACRSDDFATLSETGDVFDECEISSSSLRNRRDILRSPDASMTTRW